MIMEHGAAAVVVIVLAACAPRGQPAEPSGSLAAGDHSLSIRHDGRQRDFFVHVPPAVRDGRALPVLLAFHGGGGEANGFRAYAGLDSVADRAGLIVVYPEGTGPLPNRLHTWNAGGCCGYAKDNAVDDVGFAIAIVDDLEGRIRTDARRIYATGHSNGGMMAWRLAAERADRIAAIAPVAGAMTLDVFSPSRPVPVLHVHSVDDPRAPYEGGTGPPFPLTNTRVDHEPVEDALDRWIVVNGCATEPTVAETRRGQPGQSDASHTATLFVWSGCAGGTEVAHWKLTGAGHGWPGGPSGLGQALIGPETRVINAATEVWAFVSRFSLR
jgi:polyhydroxybutyrate depolymerase